MLDDINVLKQRDAVRPLELIQSAHQQLTHALEVQNPDYIPQNIDHVIIAGMGGSALAADILVAHVSQFLSVSFATNKHYTLPAYANKNTLVIAASYSGNTEETLSCIQEAQSKNCQIALLSSGGTIKEIADKTNACYIELPSGMQPRMTVLYQLRALGLLFDHFNITPQSIYKELEVYQPWLKSISDQWTHDTPTEHNYAKQVALHATGKTAVFYGTPLTTPLAYKWKISWNENAKNTAYHNTYPEFNHNEFIGWTSHPVEKPFAIFDIRSDFDNPRIIERMELSDQLLSGRRPKAHVLKLEGETYLKQAIASCVLADFTSIYLAVLNGVNPEPVALIETLKEKLAETA